ncbi:MAG: NACHT domain-containing protein [Anaerolineae bacterium]
MERDKRIEYNLRVYLTQLRNSFDDTKWNYTYYVPLNAERGRPLDECVDDFLNSADDRLLAIGGRIGAGKSTFLERLCFQLADRALSSADNVLSSEKWIPIHFELKGFDRGTLRKRLYNQLKIQDRLHWPKSLPTRRFLICLDGLDEIVGTIRYQTILSEIEELATFPNVKVIVTSRPQTIPTRWRGHVVCIMPLSREEVRNYFRQRLNELAEEVEKLLKQKPDLVDILQDPLMAETACKYWHQIEDDFVTAQRDPADEEVQSNQAMILQNALAEGPLLETLYEALFTHHLRRTLGKHMTAKQAQQVKVLAELAVNIDGDPFAHWELVSSVFASAGAAPQIWLDLFIDMGLLQKVGMQQFAFRNDTVKAYFAAVRLRELVCTKRSLQLAMRFIKQANEFWQHCIQLLQEIAPRQDLSPITSHLARPA